MAVYIVQGKLGTGKSKYAVGKLREALLQGRRCATNLNINMEHLVGPMNRATVIRVPDKPTAEQLDAIGHGNPDSYDEERNGVMVLDELGSWLNSRQFQDKNRAAMIDWLIHARKKGWDCYLIVQHADMIDKQVRSALAEYMVRCIRADKIRIPMVGGFLGKYGRLPRMHIAKIGLADIPGVSIDQEWFRGDHLHAAYDTRQIFKDEPDAAPFSYLSAWHLKGRFEAPAARLGLWQRLFGGKPRPVVPLKPKRPEVDALAGLEKADAWARARELAMVAA
jgi:hypothetical protein